MPIWTVSVLATPPSVTEMSSLDIDTRTDVYSLGVLLYELLTGTAPIPEQRLRSAGYGELQRLIREEEPERPLTRLTKTLVADDVSPGSARGPCLPAGTARAESGLSAVSSQAGGPPDSRRTNRESSIADGTNDALGEPPRTARAVPAGRQEPRARPDATRQLIALLRTDLDWIVMKALEKDRRRRYDTPNELLADV